MPIFTQTLGAGGGEIPPLRKRQSSSTELKVPACETLCGVGGRRHELRRQNQIRKDVPAPFLETKNPLRESALFAAGSAHVGEAHFAATLTSPKDTGSV